MDDDREREASAQDLLNNLVTSAREMAALAEAADGKRCVDGEAMFWQEGDRALIPGHVYSHMGLKEARTSGMCEYHFDKLLEPGWVDAVTGEVGSTPDEEE